MKRGIIWLMVSGLIVAALILSSCAPVAAPSAEEKEAPVAPAPAEEKEAPVAPAPAEEKEAVVAPALTGPRYGGVLRMTFSSAPIYFDQARGHIAYTTSWQQTNEPLLQGDWAKGPAGTGESSWYYLLEPSPSLIIGQLAESWEFVEPDTFIYRIRKGVYFHDVPPVNGREMDAYDVEYSLQRLWTTPTSYHTISYAWPKHFQELDGGPYIKATDKWTVVLKIKPGFALKLWRYAGMTSLIHPREMVEEYGDMNDWRHQAGTGPFILTDYVSQSTLTFARNPNYWMTDPLRPENQLPYLDGVKYFIIPDSSTRMAALRTAKVDWFGAFTGAVEIEDAQVLERTNPELERKAALNLQPMAIFMRTDIAPFSDIRVRQALHMAVDKQAIVNEYYGGQAEMVNYPILPIADFKDMYTPFEELPEAARQLYEYNPEKAKQLLAEAGYPNGFQTEVVATADQVDLLAIVQSYWADIGVDLKLDIKEYATYVSLGFGKQQNAMRADGTLPNLIYAFHELFPGSKYNHSIVDDPRINAAYEASEAAGFDYDNRAKAVKEVANYIIEQAYFFVFPSQNRYSYWQPWLKGYDGENLPGYMGNWNMWTKYVWIDQDLKEQMTGTR